VRGFGGKEKDDKIYKRKMKSYIDKHMSLLIREEYNGSNKGNY